MSFYIPDRQLRAPELSLPGRKPVGPVEIDWTNPITTGLTTCLTLQNNSLASLVRDPLFPNGWELYSGAYWKPDGVACTGTNYSCIRSIDSINLWTDRAYGTILIQFEYLNNNTPTYYYFVHCDDYAGHSIWYWPGTGWQIGQVSGSFTKDFRETGKQQTLSYSWQTLTQHYVFLNGEKFQYVGAAFPAVNAPYCFGARDDNTNRWLDGTIKLACMWNRTLSDEENKSLACDPYQFLKPQGT